MEVKSYRDLLVWQKGVDLAVECYRFTENFPKAEIITSKTTSALAV